VNSSSLVCRCVSLVGPLGCLQMNVIGPGRICFISFRSFTDYSPFRLHPLLGARTALCPSPHSSPLSRSQWKGSIDQWEQSSGTVKAKLTVCGWRIHIQSSGKMFLVGLCESEGREWRRSAVSETKAKEPELAVLLVGPVANPPRIRQAATSPIGVYDSSNI
jgi:hypothetical protein